MQRINVSLDDETYNTLRFLSFKQKKPMSEIVRESLSRIINKDSKKDAKLILQAKDENELLKIISKNDYLSEEDFEKELGL